MAGSPERRAFERLESELVAALATAGSTREGAERVLALLGGALGAQAGAAWVVDPVVGLASCHATWSEGGDALAEFEQACQRLTFGPGVGLPGRVWATGEPLVLADIPGGDEQLPREQALERAGLVGAVGLPAIGHRELTGVVELLATHPIDPGPEDLAGVGRLERHLGHLLGLAALEQRLRTSEESSASIVRSALDCIVTMDHEGRVVDFNPAAEETFGWTREQALGRDVGELIVPPELREAHWRAVGRYVRTREPRMLNRRLELSGMRADGSTFPIELTVTRIAGREPPLFAGFIRDITERRRAHNELAELLAREQAARVKAELAERTARGISEALQRSLLPPHLPEIPGVRLAAAYRAAVAAGTAVGGDFYDVFELGPNRWGLAIGDVEGKGAEAAAFTALVRYTLRAAAVQEERPSEVLRTLNEALLRQSADERFCTVVYASLHARSESVTVTLALAGHPPPLVVASNGAVVRAGRPGLLIGASPRPGLYDQQLELEHGDVMLLYTDGLIESRTPEGIYGLDELQRLLEDCGGLTADSLTARVQRAVIDAPGHRAADDVALLAIESRAGAVPSVRAA